MLCFVAFVLCRGYAGNYGFDLVRWGEGGASVVITRLGVFEYFSFAKNVARVRFGEANSGIVMLECRFSFRGWRSSELLLAFCRLDCTC